MNPKKLVMRLDTATGLTCIGWDSELPPGRFSHLKVILEMQNQVLPDSRHACWNVYQNALAQARTANISHIKKIQQNHLDRGWHPVPFSLADDTTILQADESGIYTTAATQLRYKLAGHSQTVWAVISNEVIIHIRASEPKRELDELSLQVWHHHQRHQLSEMGETLLQGHLHVCESGLWFIVNHE